MQTTRYHGKNAKIYANGYSTLRNYLQKISLSMSAESPEDTVIGATARSRVADGIVDGSISLDGNYDDTASASMAQVEAVLGSQDVVYNVLPFGDSALGDYGLGLITVNNDFKITGSYDDKVSFSAGGDVSGGHGIEVTRTLVPLAAKTTSSNSTTLDNSAATTNGGSAYIHCTAATALTSIVVTIKGSATGSFGGEETTIGTFTTITAANNAERIDFSGTVPRYIRAYWTLTGTSATIFVALHRHYSTGGD